MSVGSWGPPKCYGIRDVFAFQLFFDKERRKLVSKFFRPVLFIDSVTKDGVLMWD
jgi:hypothetical protein